MNNQQYTLPEFRPSSGVITYTRWMGANFIISGKVVGEREVTVRRHNAVVTEYLVETDPKETNLSRHVVNESDVIEIKPPCPDCHDAGIIALHGDNDTPCPRCGFSDELVF